MESRCQDVKMVFQVSPDLHLQMHLIDGVNIIAHCSHQCYCEILNIISLHSPFPHCFSEQGSWGYRKVRGVFSQALPEIFLLELVVMVHACNLSTWVVETELQAGGKPGLHSENLCQKPKQTVRKKERVIFSFNIRLFLSSVNMW